MTADCILTLYMVEISSPRGSSPQRRNLSFQSLNLKPLLYKTTLQIKIMSKVTDNSGTILSVN